LSINLLEDLIKLSTNFYKIYTINQKQTEIAKKVVLCYTNYAIIVEDCITDDTIAEFITMLNKQRIVNSIEYVCLLSCKMKLHHFSMICKSFFNEKSLLKHIKVLNISLAQFAMHLFLDEICASFEYCIIDTLIFHTSNVQSSITDIILSQLFTDKQNMNFKCGYPLAVINNSSNQEEEGNIYLANFKICIWTK